MLKHLTILGIVFLMVGCAGSRKEFRTYPVSLLCKQLNELSPTYIYYSDLVAEVNSRGDDVCKNYLGFTE